MRGLFKFIGWIVILGAIAVGGVAAIGTALPASHEETRSARISQPIRTVYNAVSMFERYPEWRPDVESIELIDVDSFREYGPNGPIVFRITEREPPNRLVIAVDDPEQVFTGSWTYELTREGAQGEWTRVRITERGEVPNPIYRAIAAVTMTPSDTIVAYLRNLGRRFGQTNLTIES